MILGWWVDQKFENLHNDGVTFETKKKNLNRTTSEILVMIHVDNAIINMYQRFLQELGSEFELSASGKLTWFLRCKVEQDLEKGTVRSTQEKYCNNVLTQFQMTNANAVHTQCESNQHLQAAPKRDLNVVRDYQQAVGSCMFLTVFMHGDCASAVHQGARLMANPGPTYIAARMIRRVLTYQAGTLHMGIYILTHR